MTAAGNALVIVNPTAGSGRAPVRGREVRAGLEALGYRVRTVVTEGPGHACAAVAEAGAVDLVVGVGGDGTFREVGDGVFRSGRGERTRFAHLALGTGNAARRAFGLPRSPGALVAAVAAGRVRSIDVGEVSREEERVGIFLLWLGAGLDAAVADTFRVTRAAGTFGIAGLARCLPRMAATFARYPFPEVAVRCDGREIGRFADAVVVNAPELAFAGRLLRDSSPGDGRLDLVLSDARPRWTWPLLALTMTWTGLAGRRGITVLPAERIELRAGGDVPIHMDGDCSGTLPVDVRIRKGALRLVVPERG